MTEIVHLAGWIKVQSEIPEGVDKGALEWVITPNLISGMVS